MTRRSPASTSERGRRKSPPRLGNLPGRLIPLLWLLLCVAAALFFSLLVFLPAMLRDFPAAFNLEFWYQFLIQISSWMSWAALGPLIVVFVRRLRSSRLGWKALVPLHAGAAVLFVTAHSLFAAAAGMWILPLAFPRAAVQNGARLFDFFSFGIHFPIYGLLLAGTVGYDAYRRARNHEVQSSRLEAQLAQSQLQVLKTQMHPHFLFNTLHGISALIPVDPEAAELMIGRLSELLRWTLKSSAHQENPLRDEIAVVRLYLEIMEIRYKGRLRYVMEVDPVVEDALVPGFILQPLVENAVRYGIASRESGGSVRVGARRLGERLVLDVEDDGTGFPEDLESSLGKGMGLGNTIDRLALLYGGEGRLRIEKGSLGGAGIVLELPLRHAPAAGPGGKGPLT